MGAAVDLDEPLTFGQRAADRIAQFGGSWAFIFLFMGIIVCWMAVNSFLLYHRPFDPYPYILLNLVLSCLAALQAPVIMMSQNRQAERDRIRDDRQAGQIDRVYSDHYIQLQLLRRELKNQRVMFHVLLHAARVIVRLMILIRRENGHANRNTSANTLG